MEKDTSELNEQFKEYILKAFSVKIEHCMKLLASIKIWINVEDTDV